jgi:hypothetical protein
MITAKKKDEVLDMLVYQYDVNSMVHYIDGDLFAIPLKLKINELGAILNSFKIEGLISEYRGMTHEKYFDFIVNEKAHLKLSRGGFQMEEIILELELTKLNTEIDRLNKKIGADNLSNITTIASNLTSILSVFFKK